MSVQLTYPGGIWGGPVPGVGVGDGDVGASVVGTGVGSGNDGAADGLAVFKYVGASVAVGAVVQLVSPHRRRSRYSWTCLCVCVCVWVGA